MASARQGRRSRDRSGRRGQQRQQRGQPGAQRSLPYGQRNAAFFAAGLASILIGYLCLAQPPVDGFLSLTLAPILLVIGYCVLIPLGLLLGEKAPEKPSGDNGGG